MSEILAQGYMLNFIQHPVGWSVHLYPASELNAVDSGLAFGGTARFKEEALDKAVSEFVERKAVLEQSAADPSIFDSTGFAARPYRGFSLLVELKTRTSAMLEASERYFGYNWWEDHDIGQDVHILNMRKTRQILELGLDDKFSKIALIEIKTPGLEDVLLLVGYFSKGFTIGCAAGWVWDRPKTLYRASVELLRHYHIVDRLTRNPEPLSPYSAKLLHLASGAVDANLLSRISKSGRHKPVKPCISFDGPVQHSMSSLYYVHRFAYEGQPDILASVDNIII